ncbi:hypothetical protein Ait01nite_058010 [Actinoplanes italicus]|uniref:Uncharacterized protein n=1 Tax=Actinoplanes italicus TaxID=113567 RepID=A0A2T0K5U1_9ACTN|nr:hypothetical protein [Actinoplanes italicus]PRX18348.1 hypothetical protein CLV67_113182 [Actinoplanes italicus]GIE32756.1 hypothetical protein Ait01nite_058010 [Actinoplanes italicus]
MTTDRLTELLEETAADVPAPSFAASAWARSRRVRRTRQVVASAVVVVAVAAVVIPLNIGRSQPPPPALSTESPQPPVTRISTIPPVVSWRGMDPFPAIVRVPADARPLTGHPVEQAVAVFQEQAGESDRAMRPLHVLDTRGEWIRVDVGDLVRTHDAGGNEADPLRVASLSPDRRRVAVAQPQALVVVDLPTAKASRYPVPGLNEQVMWWGPDTVLVGADGPGVTRVDLATGEISREPAAVSAWNSAGSSVLGGELAEIVEIDGRSVLRVWEMGSAKPVRELPVDQSGMPPGWAVDEFYGQAISDGNGRIAVAGWGSWADAMGRSFQGGAQMLTVVDTRTGALSEVLVMEDSAGPRRSKSCCAALSWYDSETVLARTDHEGVIAWRLRGGGVTSLVTAPFDGRLALRMQ